MLVPPPNHPNVDWSVLPPEARELPEVEDGFRGYVVEFYNQVIQTRAHNTHTFNNTKVTHAHVYTGIRLFYPRFTPGDM